MNGSNISILVIEGKEEDGLFFRSVLEKSPLLPSPCRVTHVKVLEEALSLLERPFHLILVNLFLADSQGLPTFRKLAQKAPMTPIVVMSDTLDEKLGLAAIAGGAQDYIAKSELDLHFFARIVRFALERHHIQEALRELSFTDELTGIYNRRGLMTLAEQQFQLSKRLSKGFFLFLVDIDNLKRINDTRGHLEGDKILMVTAECLKKSFRTSDVIGRIGGDEFAILALTSSGANGEMLLNALQQCVMEYNLSQREEILSLSCGLCYFDPAEALSLEELFEKADADLYRKKRAHHLRS